MSAERPIIAAMLREPQNTIGTAWAWLSERDFEQPEYRWVYRVLVSAWEQAGGDFVPADDYADVWRKQWTLRYGHGDDMGWAVDELLDEGDVTAIPALFEGYCLKLACVAAGRRTRALLARWYMFLTDCAMVRPDGDVMGVGVYLAMDDDDAGQAGALHTLKRMADEGYYLRGEQVPYPDVPKVLAVIDHELHEAIRIAPRPPVAKPRWVAGLR